MPLLSWRARARPKQLPPAKFTVWLLMTGRGWGKNTTGANTVIEKIRNREWHHCALVGPSAADVRDMMIDPDRKNSGIMANASADFYPKYEPSKRQLVFPNGGICTAYSAEDPDQLRGPTHDSFWADELAAWKPSVRQLTWSNLEFTLRAGLSQGVITTTPRPILLLKQIINKSGTVVTRGSTYENIHHLSKKYINEIIRPYEGTRQGRQELDGELLEDNDAALFDMATIDANRIMDEIDLEQLDLIVVGVDPTGSQEGHGCGIVIGGRQNDIGYMLDDWSLNSATPNQWARRTIEAYDEFDANYVVVERNYGGEMVANTIRLVAQSEGHSPIPIKEVNATRGKTVRAEPISMLNQQNRIKHVGIHNDLEDQLYALEAGMANDRADAYVWVFTDLIGNKLRRVKIRAGDAKDYLNKRDREPARTLVGSIWNKRF